MRCKYWIDNIKIANFEGSGYYDIPAILAEKNDPRCNDWIGFNYANSCKQAEQKGIHFFIDDYQFLRVWRSPTKYIECLKKFSCVLSPDFSLFSDYPKAMMIYNHYRKHWVAAYWQSVGIKVIPTIAWADESSFAWCFDGEPTNAIVAVSSVGTQNSKTTRDLFVKGYQEMLKRLNPIKILVFGNVPEGLQGNINNFPAFHERFNR